jgi:putative ABC transport system substrate-binding protein
MRDNHPRRREFIALLGSAALAWLRTARAQQPAMPVIGMLSGGSVGAFAHLVAAFREGLKEIGYVEGRNVAIEFRWADGQYDRLPALMADLVRRQVTVIAATTTPAALAAKAATTPIPIVFATDGDPVQLGLTASLSRPGGNVTGVANLNMEIAPKRLELAHELCPHGASHCRARQPGQSACGGRFARLACAVSQFREFAASGGLVSYGGRFTDSWRQVGVYAGRIIKGEKPADLPVVQSTKVELILNLKTAKALGLTVPLSLVGRADEVIE